MKQQRAWTQIEIDFVMAEYKHIPTPIIAKQLDRSYASVDYIARRWGLRKSAKGRTAGMKHAWENRRAS